MRKTISLLFVFLFVAVSYARVVIDPTLNVIENSEAITAFYDKLEQENGNIEILHIGDSHVQANFWTDYLRTHLQERFGNAGRGLVFPYRLARTNGARDVQFFSDIAWKRHRIITEDAPYVGGSGFSIYTKHPKFFIQIKADSTATFSELLLEGEGLKDLRCGIPKFHIKPPRPVSESVSYRVKQGDYLGKIARKFRVSVKNLKLWNRLRGDFIRAGQKLRIVKKNSHKPWNLNADNFEWITPVEQTDSTLHLITSEPISELFFVKDHEPQKKSMTKVYGCSLKNRQNGVVYNSIGANGAKFRDYNESKLFFTQLEKFTPDLIILSIGTNEAFDGVYPLSRFKTDLLTFCERIRLHTGCNTILLTTPPSALVHRRYTNKKLPKYASILRDIAQEEGYAIWDLHTIMKQSGGMRTWYKKGLASKDRVHFSKAGYVLQGELLYDALINKRNGNE